MYHDYECGDYDPEFDRQVREEVAIRTCDHWEAWKYMYNYHTNEASISKCFCPNCGTEVTYKELCPMHHEDWAEQRAEMAAEQAFEDRLYGVTD